MKGGLLTQLALRPVSQPVPLRFRMDLHCSYHQGPGWLVYSLIFCFLNHVVSLRRLRLHVTQEVPLPPFIYNHSCHIEGNVDLGSGESKKKEVLLIMLSYFVN